jgi:RimJ/RimL family protein N-acetyltransferase
VNDDLASRIGFQAMRAEHLPLFRSWIELPHVREWWGDPAEEAAKVQDMIEGRDSTKPYIVHLDGAPVGYIQVWYPDDWRDAETVAANPWVALLPEGCAGVDICIGDAALIGRGVGSTAVRKFTAGLVAQGLDFLIIDPDPANERAVRAYRKAGYREHPGLVDPTGDVLLLKFDPQANKEAA